MTVSIRPLHPVFVGEVSGVDITRPITRDDVAGIEAGMDRFAVLVFREQRLTDETQLAFTLNFGDLEHTRGNAITKATELRLDPAFADVSNLDKDHKPLARDNRRRLYALGNRLWHSDSSFRAVPATYSLLSGRIVVDKGGQTEFADLRAAYDALDAATKAEVADLVCEHSLMYSREQLGFTEFSGDEREAMRPVLQRLVRTHPVTGRKSLFLAAHIGSIIGWPVPEARAFIRDLMEQATQPEFVYSHPWRQWDLVMWDNRQVMHRVRRFDDTKVRDMRRTTVGGTEMTVAQGSMTVSIRQITPVFAGEVSGIDITQTLSRDDVAAIEAGMDRHAVLVFHDQHLTDDAQRAFTRNFGTLEASPGGHIATAAERRLPLDMQDASNLDKDGRTLARDDRRRMFNLGNRLWHSDSSYRAVPAKYSLLSGRIVVDRGGHTEFADMRAAYDALDNETKAEIEELVCEHSLMFSRGTLGFTELSAEERVMFKPVRQRLVRTHPVTGRKSLFLSAHGGGIVGWPVPEARAFLRDLVEHATQRQFVYSHRWRQGDLVIWDNRQTMHRVTRFDETQVRDMRRTTVAGDVVTVAQAA